MTIPFAMRKKLDCDYETALVRVPDALKTEGFGVLTEIDVRDTLQRKLGVEFRRYKILGACNPPLALEALTAELEIGLMLPCNFVVYEGEDGMAQVAAVDPTGTIGTTQNPTLMALATAVREKIERVLERLE